LHAAPTPSLLRRSIKGGWGYGSAPETLEAFYARFQGLTDALLDNRGRRGDHSHEQV